MPLLLLSLLLLLLTFAPLHYSFFPPTSTFLTSNRSPLSSSLLFSSSPSNPSLLLLFSNSSRYAFFPPSSSSSYSYFHPSDPPPSLPPFLLSSSLCTTRLFAFPVPLSLLLLIPSFFSYCIFLSDCPLHSLFFFLGWFPYYLLLSLTFRFLPYILLPSSCPSHPWFPLLLLIFLPSSPVSCNSVFIRLLDFLSSSFSSSLSLSLFPSIHSEFLHLIIISLLFHCPNFPFSILFLSNYLLHQ